MPLTPSLAIITALKEELAALEAAVAALPKERRAQVRLARAGIGGGSANAAANKAIVKGMRLACCTGFAGGLVEGLAVGEIVVVERVIARKGPGDAAKERPEFAVQVEAQTLAEKALTEVKLAFKTGVLVTSVEPVLKSAGKAELGRECQALCVDMESAAVARVAKERGAAFFSIRTISDAVGDELPEQVGDFLNEEGNVRAGQVLKFALGGPKHIRELMRLKTRSDAAAKSLAAAWTAVLPGLLDWCDAKTIAN